MRWGVVAWCVVSSLLVSPVQAASETQWMKVLLDGRKVGQMSSTRTVADGRITTTERMELVIERAGIAIPMRTEETSIETSAGKPIGFASSVSMSGVALRSEGTIAEGKIELVQHNPTGEQRRTLPWPDGAVLAEGARLAQERAGFAPGTAYTLTVFQALDQTPVTVDITIVGPETLKIDGQDVALTRIRQAVDLAGAKLEMQSWVDDDHDVRRSLTPLLGLSLEMVACDEACAAAPNQPADVLDRSMISAPRALSAKERQGTLRYELVASHDDPAPLPNGGEQHATRDAGHIEVAVDPTPARRDTTAPTAADREPSRFLDSDDAKVIELARQATADVDAKDDVARMQTLQRYVGEYISNKSMRVGYATASQTVASREGDCTEHAVLLAAMGRALGIPTRVVSGLAYTPAFAGRKDVFVPHAWTQAFVAGGWRSYDAALGGFDAGHIALSTGNGEPAGFYASVTLFGYLRIAGIEAVE